MCCSLCYFFFFSSRRRHTRCALVTGVQTCALPICHRRDAQVGMTLPSWHEEAISKAHDRASFDCGVDDLNVYLQRYARQSHEAGGAKTFLAIDDTDNKTVLGFYSIAPGSIDHAGTPEMASKGLARH